MHGWWGVGRAIIHRLMAIPIMIFVTPDPITQPGRARSTNFHGALHVRFPSTLYANGHQALPCELDTERTEIVDRFVIIHVVPKVWIHRFLRGVAAGHC